jgi:hypothetical protein
MMFLHLAFLFATTAAGHVAAVFFAMSHIAMVGSSAFMVCTMVAVAMFGRFGSMFVAMRYTTAMSFSVSAAMLSAGCVFFTIMISAMIGAIVMHGGFSMCAVF